MTSTSGVGGNDQNSATQSLGNQLSAPYDGPPLADAIPGTTLNIPAATSLMNFSHTVSLGETVDSLAARYNIDANAIRAANPDLLSPSAGSFDFTTSLPELQDAVKDVQPWAGVSLTVPAANPRMVMEHTVMPGETIESIAKDFDVKAMDLRQANLTALALQSMLTAPPSIESGPGKYGLIDTSKLTGVQLTVADTYNKYGAAIEGLADEAGINVKDVLGIITQETGGAIDPNARMTIRFEAHKFDKAIDPTQQAEFDLHFQFNQAKGLGYKGQKFNATGDPDDWHSLHPTGTAKDQDINWSAFNYAYGMDPEAAAASISMGPGQVMGFNHATVGYVSADAMYKSLKDSAYNQFASMTDFIGANATMKKNLNDGDYDAFAKAYNGGIPGYGDNVKSYADAFAAIVAGIQPTGSATYTVPGAAP